MAWPREWRQTHAVTMGASRESTKDEPACQMMPKLRFPILADNPANELARVKFGGSLRDQLEAA